MDRREAVKYISVLLGGSVVGSSAILNGCRSADSKTSGLQFTEADILLLNEIADTILPDTSSSPGAKAAGVGKFMTVMVDDCYEKEDQEIFHHGMKRLNETTTNRYKDDFMKITSEQRLEMLIALDQEQKEFQRTKKPDERSHYFRMMKELALLGYFTSEVGQTKAMRYIERPGRYNGCVPYTKGEKTWV